VYFLVGMLIFSGYGSLAPAQLRCSLPGAIGCPGGVLGPLGPAASTAFEQFFNITMYDYGFWIIDTASGANESTSWNVYEGWTVHVNATSTKADSSVGGTAYHGIGIELNATGNQLFQISAGVGKWAAGSFVAPSKAYYHQHIWCTVYCGPGHGGMQSHILNIVPSTIVPTVSVHATPTNGTAPLPVTFTGSVTGGTPPVTTSWNFGDGGSANGSVNTTHTYSLSGSYTAVLTAVDHAGFVATGSVSVTISSVSPLNLSAHLTPTVGVVPFQVALSATATGGNGPYTFQWTLGDGATTAGASVAHVYTSAGLYSVSLVATDATGQTATLVSSVTAMDPTGSLNVSASAAPANGPAPVNVSFHASATGTSTPANVLWLFGDGSSSTTASPLHTYTIVGQYIATVFVTSSTGAVGTATVPVNVSGPAGAPLRAFVTADPTTGAPPLLLSASVSVEGGSGSYQTAQWSFGDGSVASGAVVSHTFSRLGTFAVSATVAQSAGANVTVSTTVRVEGLQLTLSANATRGDAPFAVQVGASVVGGSGSYGPVQWIWGDGASGTGNPSNHSYALNQTGALQIRATVTDSLGATASALLALVVLPPPTANLTVQVANVAYPPTNATFVLNVTGGQVPYSTEPLWDFGDGTTTRGPSPQTHTYHKPGRFLAVVTTNDSFGRVANTSSWVTVSGGAAASGGGGGGGATWTFSGVADPDAAAMSLLALVAISGLAVLVLKRPGAPPVSPAKADRRAARPGTTVHPATAPEQPGAEAP
jgi:PKD repeat protein